VSPLAPFLVREGFLSGSAGLQLARRARVAAPDGGDARPG
jgi:hypothetical protein